MPGFLGGSTGGTGTGGEITFPKEFIDPVTKLRISQPENLIDTDFEYGLQPTKWETVELINNTPSFFSKSGDTTIPGIVAITTNDGTREITVVTALEHGLAPGIPINVTGTKSVTADGSYIINSIPNTNTFTYLCKDNQNGDNSIEDLYTSIITGEFFQGSQLRISDAEGIITDGEPVSTLTVKTDSVHGFGVNTPFYFLNLNSTISQEFEAANTAAKSFDSSNLATAQTFDGSNTLASTNIDWSNSATVGGVVSPIGGVGVNVTNDTITVTHTTENFVGRPVGTPLYYNVTTSTGYFATNPRGVVFLKELVSSSTTTSTFKVSAVPDGDIIDLTASMSGTFQLANQARTFAGNNVDATSQVSFTVAQGAKVSFEANNSGELHGNRLSTVASYSGSLINVTTTAGAGLGYYTGAMVFYSTTGSAASGLTNNTTYFIDTFFPTGTDTYSFTIKPLPTSSAVTSISGGSGTQTFTRIGLSFDKEVVHVRNSSFAVGDLIEYSYPPDGQFNAASTRNYYYIATAYDTHNYVLSDSTFAPLAATGGNSTTDIFDNGFTYRVHTFTSVGTSALVVSDLGSTGGFVEYLIVAGGGGGGAHVGGGGGGGGVLTGRLAITSTGSKAVVVGAGAAFTGTGSDLAGLDGANSSALGLTAIGGGGGGSYADDAKANGRPGGSGGGASSSANSFDPVGGAGTTGQGNRGGNGGPRGPNAGASGSGGGGAADRGDDRRAPYYLFTRQGGNGLPVHILGTTYYFGGGGGASAYPDDFGGNGGKGGGGGGANSTTGSRPSGLGNSYGLNASANGISGTGAAGIGGAGAANTGGGGGGGAGGGSGTGSAGGSGIVVIRYPITELTPSSLTASGGTETTPILNGVQYRVHRFNTVGTTNFNVASVGAATNVRADIIVIAGGGGGGNNDANRGAGGGAGGVIYIRNFPLAVGTYSCVVGAGGGEGVNGNNSVFSGNGRTLTALGGGRGAWNDNTDNASTGGSGGGGWFSGFQGKVSTQPQNTNDGVTVWPNTGYGNQGGHSSGEQPYGGGGGGAGAAGNHWDTDNTGPSGGDGIQVDITGTLTYFAGGGGSAGFSPQGGYAEYAGGLGGGGLGSNDAFDPASNGAANTGSGGGAGGSGGSGTIIIRYPIGAV
jgi:hypothetical protein